VEQPDLENQPDTIEIPVEAISTWNENSIMWRSADLLKAPRIMGGVLVQVTTKSEKKSNVNTLLFAPQAPTDLKVILKYWTTITSITFRPLQPDALPSKIGGLELSASCSKDFGRGDRI
jgi:hypothetical protein